VTKKSFTVITMLFMVFIALQLATPAAAVKIDHGYIISDNGLKKVDYTTQIHDSKHIKIYTTIYVRDNIRSPWALLLKRVTTLDKMDKDTLRITTSNPSLIKIAFTNLNAVQYYWTHKYDLVQ